MIERALVDVNILLDVLGRREPFWTASSEVWSAAETARVRGLVSADSFSTVYFLLRRWADAATAKRGVRLVRDVFEIVPLDEQIIHQAIDAPIADFEDALQHQSAVRAGADCIVTRDLRDFRRAELPILAPEGFLQALDGQESRGD